MLAFFGLNNVFAQKVNFQCLWDCSIGGGAFVAKQYAKITQTNITVYDIRPVKEIPGFYHLAVWEKINEKPFLKHIITTDGNLIIPVAIRLSPARPHVKLPKNAPLPENVFFKEEQGMYLGPIAENLDDTFHLAGKGYHTILVIDHLWNQELKLLIDYLKKNKCETKIKLYFVPTFVYGRSVQNARIYWALVEDFEIPPFFVAYFISGLGHEYKGFEDQFFQAAVEFIINYEKTIKKGSPDVNDVVLELRKILTYKWTPENAAQKTIKTLAKAKLPPLSKVALINNRLYFFDDMLLSGNHSIDNLIKVLNKNNICSAKAN